MKLQRYDEKAAKAIDLQAKMVELAWNAASEAALSEGLVAAGGPLAEEQVVTDEEGTLQGLTASGETYLEEFVLGSEFIIDVLIPEEVESGDGRTFKRGAITKIDGPMPPLWQQFGQRGHDGAMIVGRIDSVERLDDGSDIELTDESPTTAEVAEGELSQKVMGEDGVLYGWGRARGVFDVGPYGREAERLVRGSFLTKISADMDQFEAQTEIVAASDEPEDDGIIKNDKVTINKARLIAGTLVSKPAYQQCSIRVLEPEIVYAELPIEDGMYEEEYDDEFSALAASAAPVIPPKDWFKSPELNGPTPITVLDDGRVFGHIAAWHVDHIGLPRATKPPRSASNYAYFRTGLLRVDDGTDVPVGQLTLAGGHASLNASAEEAVKHYDDTASAVADVAAGEDQYGIWVAGALRPEVRPEQVRALRASAPSGDWRPINGRLELVAICQVNVPGFPVARSMVAGGKMLALVAAGARPLAEIRAHSLEDRIAAIEAREFAAIAAEVDKKMETLLNEQRESLAASAKPSKEFLESLMKSDYEKKTAPARSILDNLK